MMLPVLPPPPAPPAGGAQAGGFPLRRPQYWVVVIEPLPSSFLGRASELDLFERTLAAAAEGLPAALLVGGEAGIGKSALVVEAARRAGARMIVGRCVPMGGDVVPLA